MVGVYRTTLKGRPVSIQATRASSLIRTIGVLAAIEHRPHVLLRRRGRGRAAAELPLQQMLKQQCNGLVSCTVALCQAME